MNEIERVIVKNNHFGTELEFLNVSEFFDHSSSFSIKQGNMILHFQKPNYGYKTVDFSFPLCYNLITRTKGRAMNKRELKKLKKYTDTLTDKQLEDEYYDTVYKTLGSQAEEMYERGYDIADILEREKYERELDRQADMLEYLCAERGIKLWGDPNKVI